jgi:hypothetical protein
MSTTIKTATDYAKDIRAALKTMGITSRQVSVKSGYCGYSDYIHVTVKTAAIDIKAVETIVKGYEYISRDERTGEILEGGNTYTRTQYSDDAFDEVIKPYMQKAENIMQDAAFDHFTEIAEKIYLICEGNTFIARDQRTWDRKYLYNAFDVAKVLYTVENFNRI